jgi:hypothetical protein
VSQCASSHKCVLVHKHSLFCLVLAAVSHSGRSRTLRLGMGWRHVTSGLHIRVAHALVSLASQCHSHSVTASLHIVTRVTVSLLSPTPWCGATGQLPSPPLCSLPPVCLSVQPASHRAHHLRLLLSASSPANCEPTCCGVAWPVSACLCVCAVFDDPRSGWRSLPVQPRPRVSDGGSPGSVDGGIGPSFLALLRKGGRMLLKQRLWGQLMARGRVVWGQLWWM